VTVRAVDDRREIETLLDPGHERRVPKLHDMPTVSAEMEAKARAAIKEKN
jgi:hypothetical protein